MTAIDVVNLWNRGLSDADVAGMLAQQRGYDRASALARGETDRQIIGRLITTRRNTPVMGDASANQHEMNGERYSREVQYGRAAAEFSLAIEMMPEDRPGPYKSRADVYLLYLKAVKKDNLAAAGLDGEKQATIEKSKALLCQAIRSDYAKAEELNNKTLAALQSNIFLLTDKMKKDKTNYETESDVRPYYIKSAQRSQDQRQLRVLYRTQRAAYQVDSDIRKGISEQKLACGEK